MMPRDTPIIDDNIIGDMAANLNDLTIQPIHLFSARLASATAQPQHCLRHLRRRRRRRRVGRSPCLRSILLEV